MAIAIGSTPTTYAVRLKHFDTDGEEIVKTFTLDGATDIADIVTFLGHYVALTNAGFSSGKLTAEFDITGLTAGATNALRPSVADFLGLTYEKIDPVNSAKTARKGFLVPAYVASKVKNSDDSIKTTDTDLAAVIAFLEDQLQFVGYDGVAYPGGFTFIQTRSGFGSGARVIDGFPG